LLLRDVAFQAILEAIQTGVLRPGERLVDSELCQWLGVSRTPIREALGRLERIGLVEMAANRYTRVAEVSASLYEQAADVLSALRAAPRHHGENGPPAFTADDQRAVGELLPGLRQQELGSYRVLQDLLSRPIERMGNPFLSEIERSARARVQFHAAAQDAPINWVREVDLATIVSTEGLS
jgi:DNA-binding GntR family transcriptional regulator